MKKAFFTFSVLFYLIQFSTPRIVYAATAQAAETADAATLSHEAEPTNTDIRDQQHSKQTRDLASNKKAKHSKNKWGVNAPKQNYPQSR